MRLLRRPPAPRLESNPTRLKTLKEKEAERNKKAEEGGYCIVLGKGAAMSTLEKATTIGHMKDGFHPAKVPALQNLGGKTVFFSHV